MESILSSVSEVINNSPGLAYLLVFLGGLLSASSPCVLAIIPLVIGFVGGYSEGNKKKAITYAVVFALGLSITFTILGAIASLLGRLFGDVGKFWYYVAAAVAIIMGLYLAGVLRFKLPQPVTLRTKHKGVIGAFLLGLLFGAVSSPCATPVLAVILAFIATKARIIYGTSLLFVYAIGHCALIVLAGVFTGFVESYAKSKGVSNFSSLTKKISGGLIFLAGLYVLFTNV
ncbi:MAG: thiol:disulfide interchange protein [candidate division Zixibacteria bacterium SM1_73]|nr:MAG: thiol:disulfide interchange protein [candidate division Zixibacteria bacterium SM1_73]